MVSSSQVSAERVIHASPEAIFDVLADPAQHPVIDGSGTVQSAKNPPGRLTLGSTFGMAMRNRVPYATKPTVVEFEDDRRIAWRNKGGPIWRYELIPEGDGTRVVETYDLRGALGGFMLKRTHLPARTQENMARTLAKLEQLVVGVPPRADS